jgi:hypothetical protein
VIVAELTVTGMVPEDVSVIDCVDGLLRETLPNGMLVAFTLSVARAGVNWRAKVPDAPPARAVKVAVCDEVTDDTVAVKAALVALAGTVTVAGTVTAALLLARLTAIPPAGAAPVRFTLQASDPAPVIEALVHETVPTVSVATPAALMFTTMLPCDELLAMVRTPVKLLTLGEVKCSVTVAVCPGLRVAGTLIPAALKSEPATERPETVTGAVPVELRVMVWVALCPVWTFPKLTLVVFTPSVGVDAFN